MDPKQFNVLMPVFMHGEFADLQVALRELGTKPAKGDLVAALVHQALAAVEETKAAVEDYVVHELAKEREKS